MVETQPLTVLGSAEITDGCGSFGKGDEKMSAPLSYNVHNAHRKCILTVSLPLPQSVPQNCGKIVFFMNFLFMLPCRNLS